MSAIPIQFGEVLQVSSIVGLEGGYAGAQNLGELNSLESANV